MILTGHGCSPQDQHGDDLGGRVDLLKVSSSVDCNQRSTALLSLLWDVLWSGNSTCSAAAVQQTFMPSANQQASSVWSLKSQCTSR
jgi:hypothetical protein